MLPCCRTFFHIVTLICDPVGSVESRVRPNYALLRTIWQRPIVEFEADVSPQHISSFDSGFGSERNDLCTGRSFSILKTSDSSSNALIKRSFVTCLMA
jgi:hypothetical protein